MKRRRCPTGKLKHFNEAWAQITATRMLAAEPPDLPKPRLKPYRCPCGWWHIYDKNKKRRREESTEAGRLRKERKRQRRQLRILCEDAT